MHDSIVEDFLDYQEDNNPVCHQGVGPQTEHENISQWLIFSVGVQGAGKHYTFDQLIQKRRLCMRSFVNVAPGTWNEGEADLSSYSELTNFTLVYRCLMPHKSQMKFETIFRNTQLTLKYARRGLMISREKSVDTLPKRFFWLL